MTRECKEKTETALYQIHGLASLLEAVSMGDIRELIHAGTSNPLLSLAGVIQERVDFCLKTLAEDVTVAE